ncbi:hypothetical protein [Acetobacter syzygii]|uniref:hypothetical protein n=1 Tax=Acetobacter syzygii TaxID=146476 RepID=UPI0039EBB2AA
MKNSELSLLYRYSKRSCVNKEINWDDYISGIEIEIDGDPITANTFSLSEYDRENGNYLSVLKSIRKNELERLQQCFLWFKDRRKNFPQFPAFFGFCELNAQEILALINDEERLIDIKKHDSSPETDQRAIHYGIHYLDIEKELEIQNSLVAISKFYPCRKNSNLSITEVSKIGDDNITKNFGKLDSED